MTRSALMQLPNGTYIDPVAVRMIDARALRRPYVGQDGVSHMASVVIETRHSTLWLPCLTFELATALREQIAAMVDGATMLAERQARGARRSVAERLALGPVNLGPINLPDTANDRAARPDDDESDLEPIAETPVGEALQPA